VEYVVEAESEVELVAQPGAAGALAIGMVREAVDVEV
jgi:hypothetical protein